MKLPTFSPNAFKSVSVMPRIFPKVELTFAKLLMQKTFLVLSTNFAISRLHSDFVKKLCCSRLLLLLAPSHLLHNYFFTTNIRFAHSSFHFQHRVCTLSTISTLSHNIWTHFLMNNNTHVAHLPRHYQQTFCALTFHQQYTFCTLTFHQQHTVCTLTSPPSAM